MSEAAAQQKQTGMLFGERLVKALLDGRKTQTRRPIVNQRRDEFGGFNVYDKLCGPEWYEPTVVGRDGEERPGKPIFGVYSEDGEWGVKCPWNVGDLLWVRETWAKWTSGDYPECCVYRADGDKRAENFGPWRPSIHMPKWAARIWLEITEERVERVNGICHRDALAEGAQYDVSKPDGSPLSRFPKLWDEHYGAADYAWANNPWCWAITFKRTEAP